MADKKYDSIVYDFFENRNGVVLLLSEDPLFKKALSSTIFKILGAKRDCFFAFENIQFGLRKLQTFQKNKIECIVFIERLMNGRPSTDTILTIKRLLPDLKVIVLVGETKRENIAYFYEIGVNNVISKPASMNNIIEKMAFTIKPQGKLSEYMNLGKRFLDAGKFKEALEVGDKILEVKPNSPAGLMLRGDVFLEMGKREEAVASYMKAHESSRLYLEPLKRLAMAYEGVDDEKHLEFLKKLDRLSPLNTERKTDIGKVHMARKELDRAEKYFDQAIETATREAMSLVGAVAEQISEAVSHASPEMSEKYLIKVIDAKGRSLTKDDIVLFNKLGIALRGQGKWREAIDNYSRALSISPDDEGLHYNMGMAYFDGGDKRMAARCFDTALEKNPEFYKESEVASLNLGTIYAELRQPDRAIPFLRNALALNPGNATARQKLDALSRQSASLDPKGAAPLGWNPARQPSRAFGAPRRVNGGPMASHQFDQIVRPFLETGAIVYLSDDAVFIRALRNIVSRVIGFKGDVLFPVAQPQAALEKCLELRDAGVPCVVFVERMLADKPTTDFIIRLKREFPAAHMIVLTWEATRETVAYFFELGVSRVLVKPASANKVIEDLAATIHPPSVLKKQMTRCESLLEAGDYDTALEMTDRILLLKPDSARGLVMRGDALMGIGEADKAVQAYMAAHESRPIFMAPLIKLAAAFDRMEDERALAYLKELDEISPLNPERKVDIAKQHLRRDETEKAEAYLTESVELAEREQLSIAGDLTERIVDAVAARAPELAAKYLMRVLDGKRVLGRDDLVHFNRLGIILRGQGQWREAVDVYKKALGIAHDDPAIHYNMGLAYWEGDERRRAMECFETALSLNPRFFEGSVGAAMNLGSLYLDLRQYEDAVPFFEHVLEIDPENATARRRLDRARKRVPPADRRDRDKENAAARDEYNMDALVNAPARSKKAKAAGKPRSGKITKLDF